MCEYCEEHQPLLFEKYKFEASIWNGKIHMMDRSGGRFTFWQIPIRCCPMCGRELRGDAE